MSDQFTKEYWPSEQDPDLADVSGTPAIPQKIDPVAVVNSALACGTIGRVAWALVERGDGLVLAIGDTNIPIDTPAECGAARQLGEHLHDHLYRWAVRRWPSKEP